MIRRALPPILATFALLVAVACERDDRPGGDPPDSGSGGIHIIAGGTGGGTGGSSGAGGAGGEGGGGGSPGPGFEIHSLYPSAGMVDGGTRVTIRGRGFATSVQGQPPGDSLVVFFGENPSLDARLLDDDTVEATTPPGIEGEVDVVVRNASGERVCAGCFRYLAQLALDAIEPAAAPVEGGTRVVLRGEGLTEETTILFGRRAALLPRREVDGSLSVVVPPGDEPGLVDVRLLAPSRQALYRRAFRYHGELAIDFIEPPASPLSGTTATIRGRGLTPQTRILVDGQEVQARPVGEGLEIDVPPATAPRAVVVEARDEARTASFPFAYVDPDAPQPALYAVVPPAGPVEGGNAIHLLGSGLAAPGAVAYLGHAPISFVLREPGTGEAVAPPGPPGAVEARLRTLEGMAVLPGAYRYLRAFALVSVEPGSGPAEGGTPLVLTGRDFPKNPRVFVGALEASAVVRVSDDRIEAVSPPGTDGPVPVRVVDGDFPTQQAVLRDAFVYEGPLRLAVVDPPRGSQAGGTPVRLRGSGFRGAMRVFFGEAEAASVAVLDPFTLEASSPRGKEGFVDVRVEREDGESAEIEAGFAYFDPSTDDGGPSGGPLAGVLNVTVIARSGPDRNRPIPGCQVFAGADDSNLIVGLTDDRGQVTLSSPALVKTVTVTVACHEYEMATAAHHRSENITFLLRHNGVPRVTPGTGGAGGEGGIGGFGGAGGEGGAGGSGGAGGTGGSGGSGGSGGTGGSGGAELILPSLISGRVWGFKPPASRPLRPHEEEVALVDLAYPSLLSIPLFGSYLPSAFELDREGAPFAFRFWGAIQDTVYAIYGIRDRQTGRFEPLLLGYLRGLSGPPGTELRDLALILDTRLDQKVPVHFPTAPGSPARPLTVTAYLDLAADGAIPVDRVTGTTEDSVLFLERMPPVAGEHVVLVAVVRDPAGIPYSVSFRRQGGDLTRGVDFGPLLQPLRLVEPPPGAFFEGSLRWELQGDLEPDIVHVNVLAAPPGFSLVPIWHAVLPGDERHLRIPTQLVDEMVSRFGTAHYLVEVTTGVQPTFEFDDWTYWNLSRSNFVAYTFDRFELRPPQPPTP